MKNTLLFCCAMFCCQLICSDAAGQIIINGHNPQRRYYQGPQNAVTIAYGSVFWVDGKNKPLAGYSSSLSFFHGLESIFSVEKFNSANTFKLGYDRKLSDEFTVKTTVSAARLSTGVNDRFDIIAHDKSWFAQLGVYGSYTLTRNFDHRVQFQWIAGPELMYAKKNVTVEEYVLDETSEPATYRQNVDVVEGALVTGLGISLRITDNFTVFTDVLAGISLPGAGFKLTGNGLGLKVSF